MERVSARFERIVKSVGVAPRERVCRHTISVGVESKGLSQNSFRLHGATRQGEAPNRKVHRSTVCVAVAESGKFFRKECL